MIYGDDENRRWFKSLTNQDILDLFNSILEKSESYAYKQKIILLRRKFEVGTTLAPAEIAELRKWNYA